MSSEIDDILSNLPWPREGDRLVTHGDADWRNKAQLLHGWGDRWAVYATGYQTAADVIVDKIKDGFGHQDFLVYPVMFLYRHALELRIKNLIQLAWQLLDKDETAAIDTHNLVSLWRICRPLLEEAAPGDSLAEYGHVGTLIDEFCQYDAGSYAFRYPVTKADSKTERRTAMLQDMKEVNLRNVQDVMTNVSALLTAAEAALDFDLQNKADLMSSFRGSANDHC